MGQNFLHLKNDLKRISCLSVHKQSLLLFNGFANAASEAFSLANNNDLRLSKKAMLPSLEHRLFTVL